MTLIRRSFLSGFRARRSRAPVHEPRASGNWTGDRTRAPDRRPSATERASCRADAGHRLSKRRGLSPGRALLKASCNGGRPSTSAIFKALAFKALLDSPSRTCDVYERRNGRPLATGLGMESRKAEVDSERLKRRTCFLKGSSLRRIVSRYDCESPGDVAKRAFLCCSNFQTNMASPAE